MKKGVIVASIFTVMLCCKVFGQSAEMDVTNGLAELATNDIVDANANFQAALALEPTNEDANVLLAVTRLLLVPQTPAGSNFLNRLNFPAHGRDVYNWTSEPPKDAFGGPKFPAGYNSTNIVFFVRTNIFPLIAASLTNFANLTDTNFFLTFSPGENLKKVTIDYGDVQLFRSGLYAAYFLGYSLNANNASFILPQIVSFSDTNGLTIQQVLSTYPSLLTPHNTNDLLPSELALSNAAALYLAGSDFIRNDRSTNDTSDLITISPDDVDREADFRVGLSNVVSSLTAPTQLNPDDPDSIVYLGPGFSGTNSLRKFVPQFFGNTYLDDTLPDYTFGGMLPAEPRYKTETAFREIFPSFAGIYTGKSADKTNGVSDYDHQNGVSFTNGAFAVYISTNGQSTLFGYDGGDGLDDETAFGFLVNFTVNAQGKWQTSNSVFNAFGSVDSSGHFNGQIDYLNNRTVYYSVYLRANQQPAMGPFQNSAGFYNGSYITTNGSGGTLAGIVAADGELFFIPLISGEPTLSGNGKFTTATTVTAHRIDGTVMQGTLNPFAFTISGIFYNGMGVNVATFTMSRTAKVNFDTPPIITANLPASVKIPLGNTLKLTLGATGSPPLRYQWYMNGTPIPGAVSSTLVVSNQLWNSVGTNTISASVFNLVGEADSRVTTVAVMLETNKPGLTITSPKPGQLWSNAVFNVTGTTSDKLGITGVFYYTNSGFFTLANTANNYTNWNATATLAPGTNTITVFAFNKGGIPVSNSVKVVYVVHSPLTILTNGMGSVTPFTNGASLQVGNRYSLTAAARHGWVLSSWSGSTNGLGGLVTLTNKPTVPFTMFLGLIMQANFTDTNKPFLKITNAPAKMLATNEFILMGTATDDVAIASVSYSLDGSPFTPAATNPIANGVSWSADLMVRPGTNKFAAYATATNGNISATNTITIIRVPSVTTFLIATNQGITEPFARIAFDETNYLAVYVGTNGGMGQFVSQAGTLVGAPQVLAPGISQDQPSVEFDGSNYLVAWKDETDPGGATPAKGVFVSPGGVVSPPITLSQSTTLFNFGTAVFGGGVYFLMWSDTSTSPNSVYGAIVDRSGTNVSGDFVISGDASADETSQNGAAFDGTNFLAVWYPGNPNDKLAIHGQLIDTSGNLVGGPILIYTNSVPTGTAPPSVLFDGTKFLVLFDIGINSVNTSAYHVIGRFITTSGEVLTNQVKLTADVGPQIIGSSDFDGFDYLMAWNQGLSPVAVSASTTINGRFFDANGVPVSVEFPIFKTNGTLRPTWSPVLFDGTRFVLAGGLGKEIAPLTFTNGVIYGAFVSP